MFLVIIDAHSKWIECLPTTNSTSSTVINWRSVFARFGIPSTIVSDNGTCFVSQEFKEFLKANGIYQLTTAPYHPASNGLAERAVLIVKRGSRKQTSGDIHCRLAKILFVYTSWHNWCHSFRIVSWKEIEKQIGFTEAGYQSESGIKTGSSKAKS